MAHQRATISLFADILCRTELDHDLYFIPLTR